MKFLLDTVTLSELRRGPKAHPSVIKWQESLGNQTFGISVVTLMEIRYGILKVERRDPAFAERLRKWNLQVISQSDTFFQLPVDRPVAEKAADFRAAFDTPYNDALLAATAAIHDLTIATRNTADFERTGIRVVNPWLHAE